MKISIKFLTLVFCAFGICLLLVFIALKSQVNLANKYLEDRKIKEGKVFNSFNQLKKEELRKIVSDYSIWDELVTFSASKDTVWANYNVKSMINSFNLDAVWVYGLDEKIIYAAFNERSNTLFIDSLEMNRIAKNDVFCFWSKMDQNYFLNYGASIRKTKDVNRDGKKYSYLIIGKKIDSIYIHELSDFTNGTISLTSELEKLNETTNTIVDTLKDSKGSAIGFLTLNINNSEITRIISFNKNMFNIVLMGAIILLMLVFGSFYVWVILPLKKITSWLNFFHPNFDLSKHKKFTEFEAISMVMQAQTENQNKLKKEILEREKAQEDLKKHQELLSSTIKSIDDIIFIIDENLVFTEFLNEENADKFRLTSDVFIGKTLQEIGLPEEVLNKYLDAIDEINISKRTEKFEYQLEAFGVVFSYSTKITPRIDISGNINGFTIVCRDITVPQKTEKVRDINQNIHEISFANNSLAELMIDVETNQIIDVNQSYSKLSGLEISNIKNHTIWEFPYFNELFSGKMEFIELQASDCSYVFNKRISFTNKKIIACDIYSYSFLTNKRRLIKLIFVPRFQKTKW